MDGAFDVIESTPRGGIGFDFKVRATGSTFRVVPARSPGQPRYWCFWFYRCKTGGMVDSSDRPWIGAATVTRDELAPAAAAMRADLEAWLADPVHRALREWLGTIAPGAALPGAVPLGAVGAGKARR